MMRFDRWNLGYTKVGNSLRVHYPYFDDTGTKVYGAGMEFDPEPEIRLKPDSERARLWSEMLAATSSESPLSAVGRQE